MAQLFGEWLELAGLQDRPEPTHAPLGPEDALVVIDMQADFVPRDPIDNPHGGRFGVSEGDHIVSSIVQMIQAAAINGSTVAATRDYHPHDHVSFISQGGPFPSHCVQGTAGSYFMPAIATALANLRSKRPDDCIIAFKAFHEDVDSFGGFPYFEGGPGRISTRPPGSAAASCPMGCTASPWTGSLVVKQSALSAAAEEGTDPDLNAPPDMLCMEADDGRDRGRLSLQEAIKGKKRLFVCGLALDFCVLDTCLNAKASGFDEIFLVLDATRAAHIPGLGGHGTGFLSEPKEVIAKLRAVGVELATAESACGEAFIATHWKTVQYAVGNSEFLFPQKLGPLGLMDAKVAAVVDTKTDRYTLELKGPLQALAHLGFENTGKTSPHARLPKSWPNAPADATTMCWAYPVDGMAALQEKSRLAFLSLTKTPELCFSSYGGFLLLNAKGDVVQVQSVTGGDSMRFLPCEEWREKYTETLRETGRLQEVTLPSLLSAGAREFCWVNPSERFCHGKGDKDGWVPSVHGAFAYTLAGRETPVFFRLINPVDVEKRRAKEAKVRRVAKVQQTAATHFASRIGEPPSDGRPRPQGGVDEASSSSKGSSTCVLL